MGNISINGAITYVNGSDTVQRQFGGSFDQTGVPRKTTTESIGTTEESISLADVSAVGWIHVRNLDATNFITLGTVTNQRGIKLLAGESCAFRAANNALFIKADTAACNVAIDIFSN